MKILYLSNGSPVQVDDADYEFLSQWSWRYTGAGYASRSSRHGQIYMHRVLAGAVMSGSEVDHKNGDKLDNRKDNLRLVSKRENQRGYRRPDPRNQSGVRGVNWFARTGKWVARLKLKDKYLNLGYYDNVEDAIKARQEAERKYWDES